MPADGHDTELTNTPSSGLAAAPAGRAALTPVVTVLGLQVAFDLTGVIFTESIFGLPGLGLLTLRAFGQYDLPVLMGGVLIGVIALVTMNLIVDILYTVLDPRVRLA